jgi:hypothetical protein
VIVALALGFALLEIGCRILPIESAYINIPTEPNPVVGYTRPPNSVFRSEKLCFSLERISFNNAGFRGPSPEKFSEQGVVILGDSYMEAREVPESATTWGILGHLLKRPVLNLAVAGYGPVAQLFTYREFAKEHKPRVVILFFYSGNDVKDGSCALTRLYNEPVNQPCGYAEKGRILWNTEFHRGLEKDGPGWIKDLIKRHCVSCNTLYRFIKFDLLNRSQHGELDFLHNVYRRDVPEKWRQDWRSGWRIIEEALKALKEEVESESGKFMVVSIPHTLALAPNWREMLMDWSGLERLPKDLDMDLGDRRLSEICEKNRIPLIRMAPIMRNYIEAHELRDPYLWFFCDGHWNPAAHFLAANLVARDIIKNSAIPYSTEQREKALESIDSNLKLGPRQIMGSKAFDQIYGNRPYTGVIGGRLQELSAGPSDY